MNDLFVKLEHGEQIEVRRRDWPAVRTALVAERERLEGMGTLRAQTVAQFFTIAIDKHDEQYPLVDDEDAILAPKVGFGQIGQTRHHVAIDHPELRDT